MLPATTLSCPLCRTLRINCLSVPLLCEGTWCQVPGKHWLVNSCACPCWPFSIPPSSPGGLTCADSMAGFLVLWLLAGFTWWWHWQERSQGIYASSLTPGSPRLDTILHLKVTTPASSPLPELKLPSHILSPSGLGAVKAASLVPFPKHLCKQFLD